VRINTVDVKNQNFDFLVGENLVGVDFFIAMGIRMMIDAARAATPPSFDGIDRRIT